MAIRVVGSGLDRVLGVGSEISERLARSDKDFADVGVVA